jgi:UDP-3-O-[3-hydroxymyristoyl] glucosamine N-acyltransferase
MPITNDVVLGRDVKIHHPELVNLYGCRIGEETSIGAFVEIQKNAAIGARCKVSSHTFICEGVTIEDEVFVGHGVIFISSATLTSCSSARHAPEDGAACWIGCGAMEST